VGVTESDLGPVIEGTTVPSMGVTPGSCGMAVMDHATVRVSSADVTMARVVMEAYPVTDTEGRVATGETPGGFRPDATFSTRRTERRYGIRYDKRGRDYRMGRARIEMPSDEAMARGVPAVAVGYGGWGVGTYRGAGRPRRNRDGQRRGYADDGGGFQPRSDGSAAMVPRAGDTHMVARPRWRRDIRRR